MASRHYTVNRVAAHRSSNDEDVTASSYRPRTRSVSSIHLTHPGAAANPPPTPPRTRTTTAAAAERLNNAQGESASPVTSFTSTPATCSRLNGAKYGLFIVNFIVWVAGGVLMGVGTWSRLQRNPLAAFDHVTVDVAYLLIAIGAVMFVVSLFGCLGALRGSLCLLKLFVVAVVIVFVAQMVAGVLAFTMLDTVEATMMSFAKEAVVSYGTPGRTDDSTDSALDYLQTNYSCCGGASYQDWEANPAYNCSQTGDTVTSCSVPTSCCQRVAEDCARGVRGYSETFAEMTINTRGCIGALMSIFKENLIIIGLIAFAVGVLQVCSLLMAHCYMRLLVTDTKFSM